MAFVTPETQYRADVTHTTASSLWNYVTASDSLSWLRLSPGMPADLMPRVGDKLVTLTQTDLLPYGFAGQVSAVDSDGDGTVVICRPLELTEAFDRYVGKVAAETVDDEGGSAASRRRSEKAVKVPLHLSPMAKTLHLTASMGLSDSFSIDGNGSVGISVKPTIDLRVFVAVGLETGVNLDCVIRGEMETQLQFGLNGIVTGHFDLPLVKTIPEIPILGCPLIKFGAEAGLFLELQGSVNVGASYTTTERYYSMVQFNSLAEGGRQAIAWVQHVKDTLAWTGVTAKATMNVGGYLKKYISDLSGKISESGIRTELGLRTEVENPVNWTDYSIIATTGLTGEALYLAMMDNEKRSRKLYDEVDKAAITLSRFSNVQVYNKILNWTFTKKWENTTQIGSSMGVVPHIDKPTVRMATMADDDVYLDLSMNRPLLFPVKVGVDVYNNRNELVREEKDSIAYWFGGATRSFRLAGLSDQMKYRAYPRIDLFGFRLYAEPTDSFSAAKAQINVPETLFTVPSVPGHFDAKLTTNVERLVFIPSVPWLSCYWSKSAGIVTIYYEAMPQGMSGRIGKLLIQALNGDGTEAATAEITVSQVNADIQLSSSELYMGVKGGEDIVIITATNVKDIEATTKSTFIHPSVSGNSIAIAVDENTDMDEREGVVTVSGKLEQTGQTIERFISIRQAGTNTPVDVALFSVGRAAVRVCCNDGREISMNIPYYAADTGAGKTTQQGSLLRFRTQETRPIQYSDSEWSGSVSWDIDLTIDPKDNRHYTDYEIVRGSVSYLEQSYHKGSLTSQRRCSYDVHNLTVTSISGNDNTMTVKGAREDENGAVDITRYLDNFDYEEMQNNQSKNYSQADIEKETEEWSLYFDLKIDDAIPILEVSPYEIVSESGYEGRQTVSITNNSHVRNIEIEPEEDWLTVANNSWSQGMNVGHFTLAWDINRSKDTREAKVYVRGTLDDGSTLTSTIRVQQAYERIWDDDETSDTIQKAELPSEELLNLLRNQGMPVYTEGTPAAIDGVFEFSPYQLAYSSNPDEAEEMGSEAADMKAVVSIQSLTGGTPKAVMRSYSYNSEYRAPAEEYLCSLTGNGKQFTLSNSTTYIEDNALGFWKMTTVTVVSGELEDGNIVNLHWATFELNEADEVEYYYIIKDGDNVSTPTVWQPGSAFATPPGDSSAREAARKARGEECE